MPRSDWTESHTILGGSTIAGLVKVGKLQRDLMFPNIPVLWGIVCLEKLEASTIVVLALPMEYLNDLYLIFFGSPNSKNDAF